MEFCATPWSTDVEQRRCKWYRCHVLTLSIPIKLRKIAMVLKRCTSGRWSNVAAAWIAFVFQLLSQVSRRLD